MSSTKQPRSLRHVAMDFLARREHSRLELRRKLLSRDDDADSVDAVLDQLVAERLQSDERFAESYLNSRVNAGVGPLKIRYELRQRGVDDGLIEAAMTPLADEWDQMMREQRQRRFGETIPRDYAAQTRQARFLQNRGFSPESVMRLFRDTPVD